MDTYIHILKLKNIRKPKYCLKGNVMYSGITKYLHMQFIDHVAKILFNLLNIGYGSCFMVSCVVFDEQEKENRFIHAINGFIVPLLQYSLQHDECSVTNLIESCPCQ